MFIMIQDNLEKYSKLCFLLPQEILKSCVLYLRVRRKARFIRVACASMINLAVTFSAKKIKYRPIFISSKVQNRNNYIKNQ